MNEYGPIPLGSQIYAGVFGRESEVMLVHLDREYEGKAATVLMAQERGLCFCGTFRWKDGELAMHVVLQPEAPVPMFHAVGSLMRLIGRPTTSLVSMPAPTPSVGELSFGEWLERLHTIPDPRA